MRNDWVVSFTKRSALKWNRAMTWHGRPSSSQSILKRKLSAISNFFWNVKEIIVNENSMIKNVREVIK